MTTLRLLSDVWVVYHAKIAFYSRNAYFELQSQWLARRGNQPARREDIVKLAPPMLVGHLLYRKAMAVGPVDVRKGLCRIRLRKIWLTFVTLCGFGR